MSKVIDLSSLKGAEVVALHNTINPENTVSKFKSGADGIEKTLTVIGEQSKGKNKAAFYTRAAGLPLATLALLAAGGIGVAKDITKLIHPAQISVLAKLKELGAHEKHVPKAEFHEAFGIDATDAKLSTVLTGLYEANFLTWEENDDLMISDAANNFLEANPELVDTETAFAELVHEKAKATKTKAAGEGSRSHVNKDHVITSLITVNPCQPAKRRHGMYAQWVGKRGKERITVEAYQKAGGIMFDLLDAVKLGRALIQAPDAEEAPLDPTKDKATKEVSTPAPTPAAPAKK